MTTAVACSNLPYDLVIEHEPEDVRRQTLLRATSYRRLWRAMIVNVLYGLYKKLAKDGYTRAYSFTIFFVDIRVIPVT